MTKIVHISDTHGQKYCNELEIPECDILIHSGDIGGRTSTMDLAEFMIWFEKQPADVKIFVPGNHDLCLDKKRANSLRKQGRVVESLLAEQQYRDSIEIINSYKVKTLISKDYVYKGLKFYGSPYSPSFHRDHWAFNADPGIEISKEWAKIPGDTDILITHTPVYGVADISENQPGVHLGSRDLMDVIHKRLFGLKLSCFGHIHGNYSLQYKKVSRNRGLLFSNGAILSDKWEQQITKPIIINI